MIHTHQTPKIEQASTTFKPVEHTLIQENHHA